MPSPGDYIIETATKYQSVSTNGRWYGVTFNPAASTSRLKIVDSGKRYDVKLEAGVVKISVDGGATFQAIGQQFDACTGNLLPAFISYNRKRSGEELKDSDTPKFDSIAVGRGRILAKEVGTDRLFHLVLDELFGTQASKATAMRPARMTLPYRATTSN